MKIEITKKHIAAGLKGQGDPVCMAIKEQAGSGWTVRYSTLAFFIPGAGKDPEEYDTPPMLRAWMAIWDAGGNEGPFEFELPIEVRQ